MASKFMTVPEKIELANSGGMGYPTSQAPRSSEYQPMKIPDTITLETSDPSMGVSGEGGGGKRDSSALGLETARQLQPYAEDVAREKLVPSMSSDRFEVPSSALNTSGPNLEQRIQTLENKVQRLTETFLSSQQNHPGGDGTNSSRGNGFWYVVTFAGWMMVPLIAVYMYKFKK